MNRLWKHHFGRGIVATLGQLRQGRHAADTSGAARLAGASSSFDRAGVMKAMHRLMMTSSAYRQQSAMTPELAATDPDNALVSRMPLVRLDAEVALRYAAPGRGPAGRDARTARRTRCRSEPDGLVTPAGTRSRLAAARLRAADAEADPDAPGDVRLPADEPELHRAPRLDRRPAGALPDEQRHGGSTRRRTSPNRVRREAGDDPGGAGRARLLDRAWSRSDRKDEKHGDTRRAATAHRRVGERRRKCSDAAKPKGAADATVTRS